MTLQVIETVRQALSNGQALRQSDLLALLATTEQLWQQTVSRQQGSTSQHRREYMRLYMQRYRAEKRADAITDSKATPLAAS